MPNVPHGDHRHPIAPDPAGAPLPTHQSPPQPHRVGARDHCTSPGELDADAIGHPVTTSRPAPERFADAYKAAAASGARAVVSVHLSSAMSGTVEAARLAAEDAPVPVSMLDSGSRGSGSPPFPRRPWLWRAGRRRRRCPLPLAAAGLQVNEARPEFLTGIQPLREHVPHLLVPG
ncbi:DegV family protein [Actinomadura madurae]|uniref:DegV family protein n=1 Tax=Actinomadura madurae TaxID=1993 RepID=UPI002026164D|nr:DegV family protein [Actinomadura madurae]URN02251.1 DegV family protein [Actinomadura madurae]